MPSTGTGITLGPSGFAPDGPGKLYCEECGDWAHKLATGIGWCVHRCDLGSGFHVERYVPDPACTCTGYRRQA